MQDLTNEVKRFALDQGLDPAGIASANRPAGLTPKGYRRPKDLLPECNAYIVMARQPQVI